MTTIAYRDGVMAADTLVTAGEPHWRWATIDKLFRAQDGTIGGVSGTLPGVALFRDWFETGAFHPPPTDGDCYGIVVRPNGSVEVWPGIPALLPMTAEFIAIGSGERFALGALEAGASAENAVRIAMKYDSGTGGEIKTLTLGETS